MKNDYFGYYKVRQSFLDNCYSYNRFRLDTNTPIAPGDDGVGYAYDQMHDAYDSLIDQLAVEVVSIVAGAHSNSVETRGYHLAKARELYGSIREPGLSSFFSGDELEEFSMDIVTIGLDRSGGTLNAGIVKNSIGSSPLEDQARVMKQQLNQYGSDCT